VSNWSSPPTALSAGIIDRAETFGESDVTTTGDGFTVSSESVGCRSSVSATWGTSTTSSASGTYWADVTFSSKVPLDTIECTVVTSGPPREVRLVEDGGTVESKSNPSAGETLTFTNAGLASESSCKFDCRWEDGDTVGRSYDSSTYDNSVFSTSDDDKRGIEGIAVPAATAATVYVEWPEPADVYAWDRVLFESATPNDSTVTVYAEEYDGSSWVEVAGPLGRGDSIPADPSRNVRFRVELSRSSVSDEPRLESIYRRRVV
jgi:hypothetical protein